MHFCTNKIIELLIISPELSNIMKCIQKRKFCFVRNILVASHFINSISLPVVYFQLYQFYCKNMYMKVV